MRVICFSVCVNGMEEKNLEFSEQNLVGDFFYSIFACYKDVNIVPFSFILRDLAFDWNDSLKDAFLRCLKLKVNEELLIRKNDLVFVVKVIGIKHVRDYFFKYPKLIGEDNKFFKMYYWDIKFNYQNKLRVIDVT